MCLKTCALDICGKQGSAPCPLWPKNTKAHALAQAATVNTHDICPQPTEFNIFNNLQTWMKRAVA